VNRAIGRRDVDVVCASEARRPRDHHGRRAAGAVSSHPSAGEAGAIDADVATGDASGTRAARRRLRDSRARRIDPRCGPRAGGVGGVHPARGGRALPRPAVGPRARLDRAAGLGQSSASKVSSLWPSALSARGDFADIIPAADAVLVARKGSVPTLPVRDGDGRGRAGDRGGDAGASEFWSGRTRRGGRSRPTGRRRARWRKRRARPSRPIRRSPAPSQRAPESARSRCSPPIGSTGRCAAFTSRSPARGLNHQSASAWRRKTPRSSGFSPAQ
jgi:hypothetical protein